MSAAMPACPAPPRNAGQGPDRLPRRNRSGRRYRRRRAIPFRHGAAKIKEEGAAGPSLLRGISLFGQPPSRPTSRRRSRLALSLFPVLMAFCSFMLRTTSPLSTVRLRSSSIS